MKLRKIFAAFLLCLSVGSAMAQMPAIPVDKNVKIGHLDNGLTYYIRHNSYPEHVASFYIAQKVGSINENDDQRGLAHLLEHLAFNGTDHFKGNSLQDYLQSIGVEYGRNLNAYTSVEKTVYYFTDVPTTRPTAVDSCMLILKDWSNGISLTEEAINDERDVVHNEYRMRIVGQQRMIERSLPKLYQNNKYGYRFPIGLMSVIDGCKPETLRAYYRKWYRPDNQAIIIVGDVDVNHIENKIKELFSGIKVPANAAKIEPVEVADNDTAIYVIDKDKEQQYDIFNIFMKHPAIPNAMKGNMSYLMKGYMDNVVTSMLGARYAEIAQEADCPFLQAGADDGDFLLSSTKGAFSLIGVAKPGKVKEAYAAVLREAKRMHDFGFTATEYQRAKEEFLSQVDKTLANKDKMKNEQFTTQYVDNFISNEPIPSVEDESQFYKMVVPQLPLEAINAYAKQLVCQSDTNLVSMVLMREAEGAVYPTEKELADIVKQVRSEKLEAYVDNVKQEPLIANLPKAGKILSEKDSKKFGYKELTLSNGARVLLKKTNLKEGEVIMNASSKGGSSLYDLKDRVNLELFDAVIAYSGLGNFSSTELQKVLAGKNANVNLHLGKLHEYTSGNCTPKDMETMFQMNYLYFTNIKKDEQAIGNLLNQYKMALKNKALSPESALSDSLQYTLHAHNPWYYSLEEKDIDNVNYDRILQIAKERTANAADFTFTIIGNFDEALVRKYIEQYIASLPSVKKGKKYVHENWKPYSVYAKGNVENIFKRKQETPKSNIYMFWYNNDTPYTLDNSIKADVAGQILDMVYLKTIREEQSAAYSASAAGFSQLGSDQPWTAIYGYCPVKPEKKDIAIKIMRDEFQKLSTTIDADMLNKTKDLMLKQYEDALKTNGYWLGVIKDYDEFGVDKDTDYRSLVKALTPASVAQFVKANLIGKNSVSVIMLPQE